MFRYSILALLALSACGPAEEAADAGSFPLFLTQPNNSGAAGANGGGGSGGGGGAGGGSLGGGMGGVSGGGTASGTGGGAAVNLAEKVWVAQESVWRTSIYLRGGYGENALSWLRAVRQATGSQVTTGTYVELADGTSSYTSGGSTLRVTSISGRSFVLQVHALVGDVSATNFPRTGESVDISWLLPAGEARCVLGYRWSHFTGTFVSDAGELMEVDVQDSTESTTDTGPNSTGSGYQTDTYGTQTYGGYVEFEDRRVDISTQVVYSVCGGSCGSTETQDYVFSHATKLTKDGSAWNLNYTSGWTKQTPSSLNRYRWQGTITGPVSGQMVKRPVAGAVEALDVVIGADRYTTQGVATP